MKKDKRCLDYRKAIKESEEQLWELERQQSKALLRDRMRFLRLLKSGACPSQAKAGKAIALRLRASEKLWSKYTKEGVEDLLTYPYQGSKGKLNEAQKQQLYDELCNDQMQSLRQACTYVKKQLGVHYTPPGIRYVFACLKVKKKTGRPVHVNKDHKGEKHFKKNISQSKATVWQTLLHGR
jgi:transposase